MIFSLSALSRSPTPYFSSQKLLFQYACSPQRASVPHSSFLGQRIISPQKRGQVKFQDAREQTVWANSIQQGWPVRFACASFDGGSFAIFCMGSSLGSRRGSLSSFPQLFVFSRTFGSFRAADLVLFSEKSRLGGVVSREAHRK